MLKFFEGYGFTQLALRYTYEVLDGRRLAGVYEIKACQRFIDDLTGEGCEGFFYTPSKAERACKFIEKMPHVKGRWAAKKQKLHLEGWQAFIICNIFGWTDDNDFRRFRDAYLKIARKNAKSTLAAAIGNYMFTMDGEFGAEVYSGASNQKQAFEVFGPAKRMTDMTPRYKNKFNIEVNVSNMSILENNSKFEPLIGDPGDGANVSCAIIDEYHEHKTDALVSTMETGMGAREQPLMIKITTAGDNIAGPCYDTELEMQKILDKVFTDESIFIMMFDIDEDDDWTDPKMLEKTNPNIGISVSREFLEGKLKAAIRSPLKQNAFKRKHLNKWVGAHTAWLNMDTFNKCMDTTMELDDFIGKDCILPVDLASKIDMVATPTMFYEEIDGKMHYYVFNKFYIPEETILKDENTHYQKWHNEGVLESVDGNEIDFNEIQEDVAENMTRVGTQEVTYDPWRAAQLAQALKNQGADIVEYRNTIPNMSPPMYELEAAIEAGRFHYDGNPIYTWMASNVVAKIDAKDTIYPRKQKKSQKIDGIVATIMAIGRVMAEKEEQMNIDDFINDPITG